MKISKPRMLLHVEGAVALTTAGILYQEVGASWLMFGALFLAPDISMLGYLVGKRCGAFAYNSLHTYLSPFLLWAVVYFGHRPAVLPFCIIWVAHIGFDRLLGYGLKYTTEFKDTHLARI